MSVTNRKSLKIVDFKDSLWSGGTGQTAGTWGKHAVWQVKPHISQTIPCRIRPTINEVQWLHLVGLENVLTKNWCALCFIGDWHSCWNNEHNFITVNSTDKIKCNILKVIYNDTSVGYLFSFSLLIRYGINLRHF